MKSHIPFKTEQDIWLFLAVITKNKSNEEQLLLKLSSQVYKKFFEFNA